MFVIRKFNSIQEHILQQIYKLPGLLRPVFIAYIVHCSAFALFTRYVKLAIIDPGGGRGCGTHVEKSYPCSAHPFYPVPCCRANFDLNDSVVGQIFEIF